MRPSRTALLVAAVLTASLSGGAPGRCAPAALDCEGDACQQVAVAFDEESGQYSVRNDSADRWVKVTASNLSASAVACAAPGRTRPLPLKSIVGAYRADFEQPGCGATGGE